MRLAYRLCALVGLSSLAACGGGGGSGAAASNPHNFAAGGANVIAISVAPGPADAGYQPFNFPLATVKVCQPGTSTCATISGVLIDTGSYGLRVMASALGSAGVALTPMPDPNIAGNTIQECLPFADGYAWGAVALANVSIGQESTSGSIPIEVIDDSGAFPPVPSSCVNQAGGQNLDSVDALGANGVLGVGVFAQDCGQDCADAVYDIYYTCPPGGGQCSATTQALADQVVNPVADFPTDNNGVILQLPPIPSAGAPTASGYLVFGIGTESNNALANATVLTADDKGNFITQFAGQSLNSSFIDSGSNALYFNDNALAQCTGSAAGFYCPSSPVSLSAVNQGQNGTTSNVQFSVTSIQGLSDSNFALDDVAGTAPPVASFGPYFDWGLPFFYSRTVFAGMATATAAPYYAY